MLPSAGRCWQGLVVLSSWVGSGPVLTPDHTGGSHVPPQAPWLWLFDVSPCIIWNAVLFLLPGELIVFQVQAKHDFSQEAFLNDDTRLGPL